jgi:hypothetical protein
MDDFFEWLTSQDGQISEEALFEVMNSLENCLVLPSEKVIVWDDGQRLSIVETARRIHLQSDLPLSEIESHVIGWLEMHYEPEGLNEQQMEQFETLIDDWVQEYQLSRQR